MRNLIYIISAMVLVSMISGCKPSPHPKNPDYKIIKPKVKYKASKKNLSKMVKKLQGRPYVWAEEGPNYFDCSGFTYYMYGSMGITIPRVARHQAKQGQKVEMTDLLYGDLIFFDTDKRPKGKITHVGMYVGNGWFTHASTSNYEIEYSNLYASKYYQKRLKACRRYLPQKKVIQKSMKTWKPNQSEAIKKLYSDDLL